MITTQVYLIMYLLMFVAAVRLRRSHPDHPRGFRAPILVSLVRSRLHRIAGCPARRLHPAVAVQRGQPRRLRADRRGGALGLGLLVPFLFYRSRKPSWKQADAAQADEEVTSVMTTNLETQTDQERRSLYIGVGRRLRRAGGRGPADVQGRIDDAGGRGQGRPARHRDRERPVRTAPPSKVIVRLFGEDGGAVCEDPNGALEQSHPAVPDVHRHRWGRGSGRSSPTARSSKGERAHPSGLLPRGARRLPGRSSKTLS